MRPALSATSTVLVEMELYAASSDRLPSALAPCRRRSPR